ncbi:MAG: sulfatase, partial [Anaerolineales bacterium]
MLLVMDSARAGNFSCYGYTRPTTPNLDALAAQSTLYEQAISVGCWTLPVHTSLFTGLYPGSHGVTISRSALPEDFPTLSRQLQQLGYQTACFSNNAYVSEATRLTQGFDTVEDVWRTTNPRGMAKPKASKFLKQLEQRSPVLKPAVRAAQMALRARLAARAWRSTKDKGARLTNQKVEDWLTRLRQPDAPFFIFVNYMECHERYSPPYPYNRKFMPARYSPWRVSQLSPNKAEILAGPPKRRAEDLEIMQALYDGELNYLDSKIGELVRFLELLGVLDETLLVVTSDHGDSLGEHGYLGHRVSLYDHLLHVPLIARYPGRFRAGRRVPQQVALVDLYPTFLEMAGAEPASIHTNGFQSLLAPRPAEAHPFTVAENTAPKSMEGVIAHMIRDDRYKYIWKSNQQHELYDLRQDPAESTNLIMVERGVARRLDEQLEAWKRAHTGQSIETNEAEYDEVMIERLRGLGYVE